MAGIDFSTKNIKKNQLVAVENKSHIFVLACSNMFIHQDGKSNILNGSCFEDEIIEIVKKFKPTVGLLNPPYKSDKKNDVDENYVENYITKSFLHSSGAFETWGEDSDPYSDKWIDGEGLDQFAVGAGDQVARRVVLVGKTLVGAAGTAGGEADSVGQLADGVVTEIPKVSMSI